MQHDQLPLRVMPLQNSCPVFLPIRATRGGSHQCFQAEQQLVRSKRKTSVSSVSLIDLRLTIRNIAHDLDVTVPPHLRNTLQDLLKCGDLPGGLRDAVQSSLQGSDGYVLEETHTNDLDDHKNDINDPNDNSAADEEEYISRQALSDIAKWSRSDQGSTSLKRHGLGP
jgi:hypothetical protein